MPGRPLRERVWQRHGVVRGTLHIWLLLPARLKGGSCASVSRRALGRVGCQHERVQWNLRRRHVLPRRVIGPTTLRERDL